MDVAIMGLLLWEGSKNSDFMDLFTSRTKILYLCSETLSNVGVG
ncbi:unnamed protein product [Prunus brigantina]